MAENYNSIHTGPDIDAAVTKALKQPGRNLLDNWYFGNPVNQRGQTEYTARGYTIDRWTADGVTVTVNADGSITLSSGSSDGYFRQKLETAIDADVVVSALVASASGQTRVYVGYEDASFGTYATITSGGVYSTTGSRTKGKIKRVQFTVSAGSSVTLRAVKLEIGSRQTLADATTRELTEIPDYGQELAKCQRYYYRLSASNYMLAFAAAVTSATMVRVTVPLPVTMRPDASAVLPSVENVRIYVPSGTSLTPSAMSGSTCLGNLMVLSFTVSGATTGLPAVMRFITSTAIEFVAEL